MGLQINRLRDIARFVLRSATDLFVNTHAHFVLFLLSLWSESEYQARCLSEKKTPWLWSATEPRRPSDRRFLAK
jgi:hypothetical protein